MKSIYRSMLMGLLLSAGAAQAAPGPAITTDKAYVDVVFVLDTTGSMSGLIAAAKEKIWAIANTLTQTQPTPEIRLGLIGYRDRGDEYITRVTDLTTNLDAVYGSLMGFSANGGGDEPESVNQALNEAVTRNAWRPDPNTYKVIFLVGDAPPHMDYQDDVKYADTLKIANERGIVVNTIQCGQDPATTPVWQEIAGRAEGRYFQVEQGGSAVIAATPYDAELARFSQELEKTRLSYGTATEQAEQVEKFSLSDKIQAAAPMSARASRAELNAKEAGARNLLGEKELVKDVSEGRVDLDALKEDELPAALKPLPKSERAKVIRANNDKRREIQSKIQALSERRQAYIAEEVKKTKAAPESLDHKLYSAIKEQAAKKNIIYDKGPAY